MKGGDPSIQGEDSEEVLVAKLQSGQGTSVLRLMVAWMRQ